MVGDLHCHTKFSDGSVGIDNLVLFGKRAGLDFIAVTDHDTMAGVTRAGVLGSRLGINVVPGMEVSCIDPDIGHKVHILCYLPAKPQRLEIFANKTITRRNNAGLEMCKRIMKDFPVTMEHINSIAAGSKAIYKVHIVKALVDLGFDNTIYGSLYQHLFKENKEIYSVPITYPSVYDALDYIRLSGGIAVLAHPSAYNSMELFKSLAEKGMLHGVELNHPQNTEEDKKVIEEYAKEFGLITTGGSDFHGFYSSRTPNTLGSFTTDIKSLEKLFELSKSMKKTSK